jgi:hypothetical protein
MGLLPTACELLQCHNRRAWSACGPPGDDRAGFARLLKDACYLAMIDRRVRLTETELRLLAGF